MTSSAARTWADHVRSGGTTPWQEWELDTHPPAHLPAPADVPGAAQLELLRRLNLLGPVPGLAGLVVHRPGPGRGPVDLRLPEVPEAGPAPAEEVLRVGSGVLADLTVRLPVPRVRRARRSRSRPGAMLGRRGAPFVVDGLPLSAADLRDRLAAGGPRRGRWRVRDPELVVLVAGPVAEALRQAWCHRVQRGSARPWSRFVGHWSKQAALPPSAEPGRAARRWVERVGGDAVHVVLGNPEVRLAGLLGRAPAGSAGRERWPGDPVALMPAATDVLRRVNGVLPFLVTGEELVARRSALVGLLAAEHAGPEQVHVPTAHRHRLARAGVRIEEELRAAGCVVHGDLAELRRDDPLPPVRLRADVALEAMVRTIHRAATQCTSTEGGAHGRP